MGKSLSVKEVANQLGLSEGKVKSMCVSGELAAVKFGNRWKITEEEVYRVQHGEAPSQVLSELKKIGIVDIEEFNKLRQAVRDAQVEQDKKGIELNAREAIISKKETDLAEYLKRGQGLQRQVTSLIAKRTMIVDALQAVLQQMKWAKNYYDKMPYPPHHGDLVQAIKLVKEVLQ